jgi:hypothetical protein
MLPPRGFVHSGVAEFIDYKGADTIVRVLLSLLAGEQGRKFLKSRQGGRILEPFQLIVNQNA